MTADVRRLAEALRNAGPLADALGAGAAVLRTALEADGVVIAVRRDGRTTRGIAGSLDVEPHVVPLWDADLDATIAVSGGTAPGDEIALVVTLALAARFLAESAQTDGLTGIANRRTFDERLREEWRRAERDGTALAVAILDIDFFKAYNDRRGHPAGDDALRRVAHAAASTLQRAGDRFARYGGEEFAAILPATSLAGGIAAAERIRAAVSALAIPHPLGRGGRLTVSVGVAAAEPAAGGTAKVLLAAADRELYRAKAAGRDRVAADGYASAHIAADAIPHPLSTLVGRESDVEAVMRALDVHRVVTLTGSAGIGKTRLALAAAHEAGERFAHVRFVDALGAASSADLFTRIAAALGIAGGDDVTGSLAASVGEPTLVVLDGCERLAEACIEVVDALADLPLRFLATSRVTLGARDEFAIWLQPLDAAAARTLFSDRAAAAGIVADADDADVAALLRRLGGSPFAIELAVGRLASTTAATVLAEFARSALDDRSDRATLGSLLEGAVAMLDPELALALGAVAVFRGAFGAADAAAVIPLDDIDARRAEELLRAIADRSLLDAASHAGVTRWRMIDPVRDAAARIPAGSAPRAVVEEAYIRWCLQRLDAIHAQAGTGTNRLALLESEHAIDEVRHALDRAVRDDVLIPAGADLCIAAVRQWYAIRAPHEGRARCEAFLDRGALLAPPIVARLHASAARLAFLEGDLITMEAHARSADALLGDRDVTDRSTVLNFLGIGAKFRGDAAEAERIFTAAREMNARLGHVRGEAIAIGALGTMALDFRIDTETAAAHFREAARMFRGLGDDLNALVMQGNLAESLAAGGDADAAHAILLISIDEIRSFDNRATLGHMLCVNALVEEMRGNVRDAARSMAEVMPLVIDGNPGPLLIMVLDYSARVARHDDPAFAAQLIAAAERYSVLRSMPLLPVQKFWRDRVAIDGQRALGAAAYEEAFAAGRAMDENAILTMLAAWLERAASP